MSTRIRYPPATAVSQRLCRASGQRPTSNPGPCRLERVNRWVHSKVSNTCVIQHDPLDPQVSRHSAKQAVVFLYPDFRSLERIMEVQHGNADGITAVESQGPTPALYSMLSIAGIVDSFFERAGKLRWISHVSDACPPAPNTSSTPLQYCTVVMRWSSGIEISAIYRRFHLEPSSRNRPRSLCIGIGVRHRLGSNRLLELGNRNISECSCNSAVPITSLSRRSLSRIN